MSTLKATLKARERDIESLQISMDLQQVDEEKNSLLEHDGGAIEARMEGRESRRQSGRHSIRISWIQVGFKRILRGLDGRGKFAG